MNWFVVGARYKHNEFSVLRHADGNTVVMGTCPRKLYQIARRCGHVYRLSPDSGIATLEIASEEVESYHGMADTSRRLSDSDIRLIWKTIATKGAEHG